MITEPNNLNLTQKSTRFLRLHRALECPSDPQTPEDTAKAELIRLISFEPELLPDAIVLSTQIMHERDFVWGMHPGVVFCAESLADHFGAEMRTVKSAIRLCGGMRTDGQFMDDPRAVFVLDSDAIRAANQKAAAGEHSFARTDAA